MDRGEILSLLRRALAWERAGYSRYLAQAATVSSSAGEAAASRLKVMAEDEERHARAVERCLSRLGALPAAEGAPEPACLPGGLKEIVELDLREEAEIARVYRSLLELLSSESEELYDLIEEVLWDEQLHWIDLSQLKE